MGRRAFALARVAVGEPGFWNTSCCVITYDKSTDIKGLTMPHCLIEAAREVCELIAPRELLQLVHDQAAGSGLFQPGEVKVRLSLYEHHCVGGEPGLFVHLIFYVLAGRSDDDKRALSRRIVRALVQRLPQVSAISLDVRDIRREVFSNRCNCLDG